MCGEDMEQELPVFSAQSENELLKVFRECSEVSKQKFYFHILSEVKISIINGDISHLLKMNSLLDHVWNEVNSPTYNCSSDNPLRNVNIIILACKYSQPEVLDFIFSDKCKILQNWPTIIGCNTVLPTDIDEYQHNAFYYAIRSGKTNVIEILIAKWSKEYSGKLHGTLSMAYSELKLKNVGLSIEMEVYVRNVLFEKDFFYNSQTQDEEEEDVTNRNGETQDLEKNVKKDIEDRIEMVRSSITRLTVDFSTSDVDETFLFIAKFIAKNIYVLKRQLKCTYDKIPWEEIEFCLVIFIRTATENSENNLLHARDLSKDRMLSHLKTFKRCLNNTLNFIKETQVVLWRYPTLTEPVKNIRESYVISIMKENDFKELYKDYERVRDEYSLRTMKRYLDMAISVKCDEIGKLLVTRTLQVIGENMKNTLESPKLSDVTCGLLLLSLPDNTKQIITELRESISHGQSMIKRVEMEESGEHFFNRMQDDLKTFNSSIVRVLCQYRIRIIRDELKKVIKCRNEDELKELLKPLHFENDGAKLSEIPVLTLLKEMEFKVNLLEWNIEDKPEMLKSLFTKINHEIALEKNRLDTIKIRMAKGLNLYDVFVIKSHQNTFESVKNEAKSLLKETSPEIGSSRFERILVLFNSILNYITSTYDGEKQDKLIYMLWELYYSAVFEMSKVKLIEEYKCNMPKEKHKKTVPKEFIDKMFPPRLTQLKKILDNELLRDFILLKNNKKYQVVVEMLVLDIYSLLVHDLTDNHLFLDAEPVTLLGSNMRNHLAHENLFISIMPSQALIDLTLNAKIISNEYSLENRRKIGNFCRSNIKKSQFEQDLYTLALQKEMRMALSCGDIETVIRTIEKGADVKAIYIRQKTALHFASEGTSIETVKLVLDEKCEVDAKDGNGQSALHIAARYGRSNIVKYLIENTKILVDQLDSDRKTPLHVAAEHGHLEVVKVLINSGASTTREDEHGYTPLHYSVRNNHGDIVEALWHLEDDVDQNDAFGGLTSLHIASRWGHLGLVKYLIRKKANVNAKSDTLHVPLHAAVEAGHLNITRALIRSGAKVNSRWLDGTTALHMASTTGQESILELLLEHETNVDDVDNILRRPPLAYAAQHGNLGIIKLLLERKAAVDMKDVTGKTPLHFAAENGHGSVVEILLKHNASLKASDHYGYTAMHFSAHHGHANVIELLLQHGSDINIKDKGSYTPLMLAVSSGHLNVTKALIDREANLNVSDFLDSTALHICCQEQFLEIAELLIKSKANIHSPSREFGITPFHLALSLGSKAMLDIFVDGGANVQDIKTLDFTALHLGTINGDLEVIQYLIDSKCDVNAQSKSELIALHLAVEQGNTDIIELLITKGSKVNLRDKNGDTPLDYAMRRNNKIIRKRLMEEGAIVEVKNNGEPLTSVVTMGFHEVVTALLDTGKFDVNFELRNKNSLLITSVLFRHKKVAEILLGKGAKINVKPNNTTPLFSATRHGDFEMVKLLLENSADPNITSLSEEVTPLYVAVTEGRADIVDILVRKEIDATKKRIRATKIDSTDKSALQLAVECSKVEVVKCLLGQENVDVNEIRNRGLPLLHIAVFKNEFGIVNCLLEKGADINALDKKSRDPIAVAAENGHNDMVKFLYKFRAKDSFKSELALTLAVKNGHLDVTKYLIENCLNINLSANCSKEFLQTVSELKIETKSAFRAKRCLAASLYNLKRKTEALNMLQDVYNQQANVFGKSDPHVLETQTELAKMLLLEDNNEEALTHFKTVYELLAESKGEDDSKALDIQFYIAPILCKQKKHEEAIKTYWFLYESLSRKPIQEKEEGKTPLQALSELASTYHVIGRYNKALRLYKKILELKKRTSKSDNLPILETLYEIGCVLYSQVKLLGAFEVFTECYRKCSELKGANYSLAKMCKTNMDLIKTRFDVRYGEENCGILEEIEKENSCIAEESWRSQKARIHRVSESLKHRMFHIVSKEWTNNPEEWTEEVTRKHGDKLISDISKRRAITSGEDWTENETFPDKDVFQFMIALKKQSSGFHMKFDEMTVF